MPVTTTDRRRHTGRRRHIARSVTVLAVSCTAFVACSGSDAPTTADPPSTPEPGPTAVASTPLTLPGSTVLDVTSSAPVPGPTDAPATEPTDGPQSSAASTATTAAAAPDPLDDLDEDGARDERCGELDLGAGLVVETLCNSTLIPTPEAGVVPTAGSLLLLPSPMRWEDLAEVDATVRTATTPDGRRVVIYVLGSDTLFDPGSADVRSTATPPLAAIVTSITTRFPERPVVVRGAADSVGEPSSNLELSERRAMAVAGVLASLGLDPAQIDTVGLGEDHPVAEEVLPDGSISDVGRQLNRRVEIVVG